MKEVQELACLVSESLSKLKELINTEEYKQQFIKKIKEEHGVEIESMVYTYGNTWINLKGKDNHYYCYLIASDSFFKER